jgi:Tfp pilus assembly protein PilN
MVRINLIPSEERPKRSRFTLPSRQKRDFAGTPSGRPGMLTGVAAFGLLLVAIFFYYTERRGLESAREDVVVAEADSVRLDGALQRVRALEATQQALEGRIAMMEDVINGRLYWIDLMQTLSNVLPEYTWLEQVDQEDLGPNELRIAGASYSNAAVTDYMRGLENSPELRRVGLVGVTRAERDDIEVQAFTLVARFEGFQPVVVMPADSTEEQVQ